MPIVPGPLFLAFSDTWSLPAPVLIDRRPEVTMPSLSSPPLLFFANSSTSSLPLSVLMNNVETKIPA